MVFGLKLSHFSSCEAKTLCACVCFILLLFFSRAFITICRKINPLTPLLCYVLQFYVDSFVIFANLSYSILPVNASPLENKTPNVRRHDLNIILMYADLMRLAHCFFCSYSMQISQNISESVKMNHMNPFNWQIIQMS